MMRRAIWSSFLVFTAIGFVGCKTMGGGITNREFDARWTALEVGQSAKVIGELFGAPREKNSAGEDRPGQIVWIYSRPEVIGHRTEIDEIFLSENRASVPVVELVEVLGNVEFHLHFRDDKLTHWKRIVPRNRSL